MAVGVGTAALALATKGGGPKPPAKRLPVAIHDALGAPPVKGISARIQFTDRLVDSSSVQGSDPLLTGASGRLWASSDGKLRLELQSDGSAGDSQVLIDRRRFVVYDASANAAYRGLLPAEHRSGSRYRQSRVPSVGRIGAELGRLARYLAMSGAIPTDVAGRPAYTVRLAPKRNGGLLGNVQLAWDAVHGTPLRAAVYAKGDSSPVLELRATDISFGSVPDSVFAIGPPPGTKVTNIAPASGHRSERSAAPVKSPAAIGKRVGFPIRAPRALVGLSRAEVRLIEAGKRRGALVTYGNGLGGIAVLELPAGKARSGGATRPGAPASEVKLPTISINGTSGQELATALGTVIRFQRAGVSYVVAGSVKPSVAESAARAL
jgi:outer membrane lipoprotein-sorting protein